MKTKTLLMSTLFSTAILFGTHSPIFAQGNLATESMKKHTDSLSTITDPQMAAANFIEHINYARVALAMKNPSLAQNHITEAREMINVIKSATTEQRLTRSVESGRIVYKYDTENKYHYFPVQTGPVSVKKLSSGPLWARNELAVTEADIVYLTLDLRGDRVEMFLSDAESAIAAASYKRAGERLALLTQTVVSVDSKVAMPLDKARDNIGLAHNFMLAKNYDGAGFALKHADDALDILEKAEGTPARKAEISMMRKEVNVMQADISKKDPSLLEKADAKMNKWWMDVKTWYNK